jgi:hypothetical protein
MQFWQEDSSEDHLAAAAWNIICLMQLENNSDLDDRKNFPN